MAAERFAWLFVNQIPSMGPLRFHRLLQAAGSADAMAAMTVQELLVAGVEEALASAWHKAFRDSRLWKQAEAEWQRAEKGEFRIVTELDPDYPAPLRELMGRPPVVYVQGLWPLPEGLALGIVGTRRSTAYGEAVAERLTAELVDRSIVTISGLANGIDTVVHRTTLNKEGRTVAALGHGFGHLYPRDNAVLFKRMAEKGTLITEFHFYARPEAFHFPRRNRIISGLSQGVVVVEAGHRSGALITARYAAEQGRDVFAVPGNVFHGSQAGCHQLIKQGAKLVESVDDILEEYAGAFPKRAPARQEPPHPKKWDWSEFSEMERQIMLQLASEPVPIDHLTEAMACSVDRLASALLSLELRGCIRHLPGQHYVANDC